MFDGVRLISEAATEIPYHELLWHSDDATRKVVSRNGILEQLGRMTEQDHSSNEDCIYVAKLAAAAVKAGHTTREIEIAVPGHSQGA